MNTGLGPQDYQYFVFLVLAAGTAVCLSLLVFSRPRFDGPEARALKFLLANALGYVLANAAELLAPSEGGTLFFARFAYFFIGPLPVSWLYFSLVLAGKKTLAHSRFFLVFLLVPVATLFVLWIPRLLPLIWTDYGYRSALGLPLLRATVYGPWFWVHIVYTYALLILGSLILFTEYLPIRGAVGRQSLWIVAGILLPLGVNALYVFRLPGLVKDFTAVGFGLGGLCFWAGLRREGLLDVVPVARSSVVEEMPDPVLVLDRRGRIADLNPAATALFGAAVLGEPPTCLESFGLDPGIVNHSGVWEEEFKTGLGSEEKVYQLRSYPVFDGTGAQRGRVLSFQDVTSRAHLLAEKDRLIAELRSAGAEIKTLRGIIPICASCKKIRDDEGYWRQVEDYVSEHSEADFSHGLCPDCLAKYLPKD